MAHAIFKLGGVSLGLEDVSPPVLDIAIRDVPIAQAAVRDWVIIYRPRRIFPRDTTGFYLWGGTAGTPRSASAPFRVRPVFRDYYPFDEPVPAYSSQSVFERGFNEINRRSIAQRTARVLQDSEFAAILEAGLDGPVADEAPLQGLAESQVPFVRERRHRFAEVAVRSALLRAKTLGAYHGRCCITGLRIRDRFGKPEAEVSHWMAVRNGGSDGLANVSLVCRSVHWMIESGELTLTDDYRILVQPGLRWLLNRLNRRGVAFMPRDPSKRPMPEFLRYHREHVFGRS